MHGDIYHTQIYIAMYLLHVTEIADAKKMHSSRQYLHIIRT